MSDAVIWHDVECGAYAVDLPLWRELAERAGGPVLELGAGTGRVALHLAEHGHAVTALDHDAELLAALSDRAAASGLAVATLHADARTAAPEPRFALVLAPMQLLQVVGGRAHRMNLLQTAANSLRPGGLFAAALTELDDAVAPEGAGPPLPDVSDRDGWVYSSLPLDVRREPAGVAVERLRQRVSPRGELSEEHHTQRLEALTPDELEDEARRSGLTPLERRAIESTADHVGSMVVICRR